MIGTCQKGIPVSTNVHLCSTQLTVFSRDGTDISAQTHEDAGIRVAVSKAQRLISATPCPTTPRLSPSFPSVSTTRSGGVHSQGQRLRAQHSAVQLERSLAGLSNDFGPASSPFLSLSPMSCFKAGTRSSQQAVKSSA